MIPMGPCKIGLLARISCSPRFLIDGTRPCRCLSDHMCGGLSFCCCRSIQVQMRVNGATSRGLDLETYVRPFRFPIWDASQRLSSRPRSIFSQRKRHPAQFSVRATSFLSRKQMCSFQQIAFVGKRVVWSQFKIFLELG